MPQLNQWIVLPLLYTTKCVDMYYCYYSTYINTGLNILTSLLLLLLLPKRFQSQNILLLPSFSSFMDPLDFIVAIHSQFCLFSYSMSHHLLLYAKFSLQKKRGPILKDFRDEKHYYESSLNFMGNGEGFITALLGSTCTTLTRKTERITYYFLNNIL